MSTNSWKSGYDYIIVVAFIVIISVLLWAISKCAKSQNEKNIKAQVELVSNIESNIRSIVEKEYQRQAVSNNFAHWEVNVNGEVTFKWNNRE
jgi:hypothetical protein